MSESICPICFPGVINVGDIDGYPVGIYMGQTYIFYPNGENQFLPFTTTPTPAILDQNLSDEETNRLYEDLSEEDYDKDIQWIIKSRECIDNNPPLRESYDFVTSCIKCGYKLEKNLNIWLFDYCGKLILNYEKRIASEV